MIGTGFIGGRPAWAVSNRNPAFVADYDTLRGLNTNAMIAFVTGYFSDPASQRASGWFIRDDNDTTSADNGGTIIVASNNKRWVRLYEGCANPGWFGAVGDGVTDDTVAIRAMFASGVGAYDFLNNRYAISVAEGSSLVTLLQETNVVIRGNGATLYDPRVYATGALTTIFDLDECTNVIIDGLNYEGIPLADPANPATGVGYIGATWVNVKNGCKNITVKGDLKNLRYGVRSGDYTDYTQGYNRTFHITLTTYRCGYPVATYLAEDMHLDIYAEGSHRSAYLAGVLGCWGTIRFKDQYIAPIQVLVTDATTNGQVYPNGESRGSSFVELDCIDMGSTIGPGTASWCCGISLSRVDPGTRYQNIKLRYYVKASNTVASNLGGFVCNSSVTSVQPSYPNNWESYIYLDNIEWGGTIDRSAQTTEEHTTGEFYFGPVVDAVSYGTVSNIRVVDHKYLPGSGSKPRGHWIVAYGLTGSGMHVKDSDFGTSTPMVLHTNDTSKTLVTNCNLRGTSLGTTDGPTNSRIQFVDSTVAEMQYQPLINKVFTNTTVQGAGGAGTYRYLMTEITLIGASVTWVNSLPNASIIHFINSRLTEQITGSTGLQVGDGTTVDRFGNLNITAVGDTMTMSNSSDTGPTIQKSTGSITYTSKTANFITGKARSIVGCVPFTAPTS